MKSTSLRAAAGCAAPCSTPTNSTWRKHVAGIDAVGAVVGCGSAKYTSAGGLDA